MSMWLECCQGGLVSLVSDCERSSWNKAFQSVGYLTEVGV